MLRDAETTSIAERMRRPPLGGNTVPAAFGGGGPSNGIVLIYCSWEIIKTPSEVHGTEQNQGVFLS